MDRAAPAPYLPFDSQPQHLATSSSLSRAPSRRQQFIDKELHPLISNLSPSATLKALAAAEAVTLSENETWDSLEKSVALASTSERAWSIKASLARKKLLEWHEELSSWPWSHEHPNGFQELPWASGNEEREEDEHWDSVPARRVQFYEERIELIKDDMETLELEDLKNYVRHTHLSKDLAQSSYQSESSASGTGYETMNDLIVFIIDRLMRALPTLLRLESLLDAWSTRLLVFREVPHFLQNLDAANKAMISAWTAIRAPATPTVERRPKFFQEEFLSRQAILQGQIAHLARSLDKMLDLLTGSTDTVPNQWVSNMDNLEAEYSAWVVEAEELVLRNQMAINNNDQQGVRAAANVGNDVNTPLRIVSSGGNFDVDAQIENIKPRANPEFDHTVKLSNGDTLCDSFLHDSTPEHQMGRASSPSDAKSEQAEGISCLGALDNSTEDLHSNAVNANHSLPQPALHGHGSGFRIIDQPHSERQSPQLAEDSQPGRFIGNIPQDNGFESPPSPNLTKRTAHRPSPLVLDATSTAESSTSSEIDSEISSPGSATSDYFSNKSSPEIRDASVIEYIGSPVLKSPVWSSNDPITPLEIISRRSSQQTERGDFKPSHSGSWSGFGTPVGQRSRSSTFVPEHLVDETHDSAASEHLRPHNQMKHVRNRSASMQSFEVVPKSEIRKIMIRRSESYSSPPGTARLLDGSIGGQSQETPAGDSKKELGDLNKHDSDSSDPLSLLERRHGFEQVSDSGPGYTPRKINQKKAVEQSDEAPVATKSSASIHQVSQSVDEELQARISSILTGIPAQIRLTCGPEADAPEVTRSNPLLGPKIPAPRAPALRFNRAQTSSPTMTLAPAQTKTSKTKSQSGEPEVKLYHLHQAGKDVPVKLFVRLVGGAGERVMVRIGGGWADLAEYLKEYAIHHGRRAAPDGRFDIQGLSSSPLASQVSPKSRPVTPSSGPSSGFTTRRQQTTPGQFETPHTPASDPALRPASRSSWSEEDSPSLGLAGPKTKRMDISPRKQAWVDDMLDQARQGGADKIGDIGKVGGTKRIFLKTKSEGQ